MSLTKFCAQLALIGLVLDMTAARAAAQSSTGQPDRFFSDKVDKAEEEGDRPTETLVQGSLTSTTFAYNEFGGTPVGVDPTFVANYSPVQRLFTDLRTQLDAKHISGGVWDFRMDARVRVSPECNYQTQNQVTYTPDCQTQSGTFGGNEYDAREFYARRSGDKSDWYIGRQYVLELAATKIDGIKIAYHQSDRWDLLAFGGLHPARGSRSVQTDYPAMRLLNMEQGARVLPIAAGLGGAYRYQKLYGSIGAVGILPMAEDRVDGANEAPRIFATGNGYWRPSNKLDFYHYLVVDAQGSAGAGLTNLSLGVNVEPTPTVRMTLGVNRVDTETLNVIAQNYLADPEVQNPNTPQPRNDLQVSRISSQSARLGVSVALSDNRFEVSTSGQVRQRPDITKPGADGATVIVFPAAQAADVMVSVVDRRSILGLRLGASVMRIFGIGDVNYNRSQATIARLDGSRELLEGRGQIEANVGVVASQDDVRTDNCALNPLECYGTSKVLSLTGGTTLFYRFKPDWFVIGSASFGRQAFSNYLVDQEYTQPPNYLVSGFARLAYRF